MCRILKICCLISVLLLSAAIMGCEKEEDGFYEISLEETDEKGTSGEEVELNEKEDASEKAADKVIYVHVCGAVKKPGVYELKEGSRVFEAVEAAGGFSDEGAEASVNQAELLSDGQQLYIPDESEQAADLSETGIGSDGKVNLNKATKEELMTLSGVGEAKADAIIRYRQEHGNFKAIEEIMEIEGIKEGVFRKIEDQITVS